MERHLDSIPIREEQKQSLLQNFTRPASTLLSSNPLWPIPHNLYFGFDEAERQLVGRARVQDIVIHHERS